MAAEVKKRPGGELSSRPLHFIWLADCSGSMTIEGKIQSLNTAIREAVPHMQQVAQENPNAQVLVRALKFSDGAQWHITKPTPVEDFKWADLSAGGLTDMGRAFRMTAEQLRIPPMTERGLPPVLVLVSDGQPTDDWEGGLKELMELPWGKRAARIAIAIGRDANLDVLQQFIGNMEIQPLQANNPQQLTQYIKWVSTAVLKAASSPPSQAHGLNTPGTYVPIPQAPAAADAGSTDDVW